MPIPVLSIDEMRAWEEQTWATGQTEAAVIQEVGAAIARRLLSLTRAGNRILILAGSGNNGADARAAEPHLRDRVVETLVVTDPQAAEQPLRESLSRCPDWVLDGWFGIGLNRPLSPAWCQLIHQLNDARVRVLAIDVPSGLNADQGSDWGAVVRAERTLTVGAPKRGLLAQSAQSVVGILELAYPVGLRGAPSSKSELQWTLDSDFAHWPPPRVTDSHKGSFGHAAVLAGSVGYAGAAVLAARAAGRARPGLVSVITPSDVWTPVSSHLAAAMVHPFLENHAVWNAASAVLVGPGLAAVNLDPAVRNEVVRLWETFPGPLVADASALDFIPTGRGHPGPRVITPHPGEAGRLLKTTALQVQLDRPAALRELARRYGSWIVLKGNQTLLGGEQGPIFVNSTGNPGLAQGGTGDVLAGYLLGLLAQPQGREDPMLASRYAAWRHGRTADDLEVQRPGWTAEELAAALRP